MDVDDAPLEVRRDRQQGEESAQDDKVGRLPAGWLEHPLIAIGEDRLILALQSQGETAAEKVQAFVAPLGVGMNVHALKLARELRRGGVSTDLGDESFRLKKSFELAEKAGARFIVIIGENEVASDHFAVKDLASGQQVQVPRAELAAYLKK